MELVVLGAGPAYTDRVGRDRRGVSRCAIPDGVAPAGPRAGLVPAPGRGAGTRRASTRSWSPTCTRTTSSTSSRCGTTCAGTCRRRVASGSSGRSAWPIGWTACTPSPGSVPRPSTSRRSGSGDGRSGRSRSETGLVTHTDESYGIRVAVGGRAGLVYSGDCGRAEDLDPLDPSRRRPPERGLLRPGPGAAGCRPPGRSGGRPARGPDQGGLGPAHPPADGARTARRPSRRSAPPSTGRCGSWTRATGHDPDVLGSPPATLARATDTNEDRTLRSGLRHSVEVWRGTRHPCRLSACLA